MLRDRIIVSLLFSLHIGTEIFKMDLQLLLMKRGGREIYVGPLGRHSSHLIKYFEVNFHDKLKAISSKYFSLS